MSDTSSNMEEIEPNVPAMEPGSNLAPEELERLTHDIIAALKTVYDPEIPSDIYEIGLIYRVDIDDDRNVEVDMTLTAPGCPVAGEMPGWVEMPLIQWMVLAWLRSIWCLIHPGRLIVCRKKPRLRSTGIDPIFVYMG